MTRNLTRTTEERETMTARANCTALERSPGTVDMVRVALAAAATALAATAALLAATPAALAAQRDCKFTDTIELTAPAAGTLRVDAGAGTLSVRGVEGIDEFRLAAKLCASDQRRLEGLDVTLRGDRLDTTYPSTRGGIFSWGNRYARIDVAVEVPMDTNLRVDDSSGIIYLNDTGDVTLVDGSGNIFVGDARSLTIEDGSGDINITRVTGDVRLEDSSGNLSVEDVNGNVVISDGSGRVTVRDVTGDVTISDGSGDLRIDGVGGSVRMDEIGSGSATVHNVDGDLVVRDGRRERIEYSDVRGEVDLPPARRGSG